MVKFKLGLSFSKITESMYLRYIVKILIFQRLKNSLYQRLKNSEFLIFLLNFNNAKYFFKRNFNMIKFKLKTVE